MISRLDELNAELNLLNYGLSNAAIGAHLLDNLGNVDAWSANVETWRTQNPEWDYCAGRKLQRGWWSV